MRWLLDLWHFVWDAPDPLENARGYVSLMPPVTPKPDDSPDAETPRFF